jgi:outer membrane protein assembly factor BamD (BamD/ComL family)
MCGCNKCEHCDKEKDLLVTVEEYYSKNGGDENMAKELDKVLEQYPEFMDKKEELLSELKINYCKGFLDGYTETK